MTTVEICYNVNVTFVTARNFIKYAKHKTVKDSQNSGKYNQEKVCSLDTYFFSDKQQIIY